MAVKTGTLNTLRVLMVVALTSLSLAFSAVFPAHAEDDNIKAIGEEKISDDVAPESLETKDNDLSEADDVSAFGRIDSYSQVVVLQKRFLPKKNRFESSFSIGFLADNPFFVTSVFYLRTGYAFSENWAAELSLFKATTSETQVTENLLKANVSSNISAVPESFYGADVKWTPIYGKLSFWNESIVPVDNYYLAGLGKTSVSGGESPITAHFGTGLSFALKKWLAVRVELDFYAYNTEQAGSFTDTHFNVGVSGFFPGATYR